MNEKENKKYLTITFEDIIKNKNLNLDAKYYIDKNNKKILRENKDIIKGN